MSFIGKLTGSDGRLFDNLLVDLERATGDNGKDAELVGQIMTTSYQKLLALGFDGNNTVLPEELILALNNRADQIHFSADRAVLALKQALREVRVWRVGEVALTRSNSQALSDETDRQQFHAQVASLPLGYFEFMPLQLHFQDSRQSAEWSVLESVINLPALADNDLKALIAVLDIIDQRLLASNQLALVLQSRHRQLKLQKLLNQELVDIWTLAGNAMPLDGIYRLLAQPGTGVYQNLRRGFPELADKLSYFDSSKLLETVIGDSFWHQTEACAMIWNQQVVSFNLLDKQSDFRQTKHLEAVVWEKMLAKYLSNDNLVKQLINQLEAKLKTYREE